MATNFSFSDLLVVDSSANAIGIGTTAPNDSVHIYRATSASLKIQAAGATSVSRLRLVESSTLTSNLGVVLKYTNNTDTMVLGFNDGSTDGDVLSAVRSGANASSITMSTSGSPAMSIDSVQRVGIGTTSPDRNLTISASSGTILNIKSVTGTIEGMFGIAGADSTVFVGAYSNHPTVFRTNNTERARIDTSGDLSLGNSTVDGERWILMIGAGTSRPFGIKFSGNKALWSSTDFPTATILGSNNTERLRVETDGTFYFRTAASAASNSVIFNTTATNALSVNSSGFVGVGTASASNLLHIKATNPVMRLEASTDSAYLDYNATRLQISAGGGALQFVTGNTNRWLMDAGSGYFYPNTDDTGSIGIAANRVNSVFGRRYVYGSSIINHTVASGYTFAAGGTAGWRKLATLLVDANDWQSGEMFQVTARRWYATGGYGNESGTFIVNINGYGTTLATVFPATYTEGFGNSMQFGLQNFTTNGTGATLYYTVDVMFYVGDYIYYTLEYLYAGNEFSSVQYPNQTLGVVFNGFAPTAQVAAAGDLVNYATPALFKSRTGDIGIATATPVARLTVLGTSTYNSDTVKAFRVGSSATATKAVDIGFDTALDAGFIQAANFTVDYKPLLLNPNNGNVAIGSTTPNATGIDTGATRFFVVAPNTNSGMAATFIADSLGRGILVADQSKANSFAVSLTTASSLASIGTNTSSSLAFTTGASEKARIDTSGNFGIGTGSATTTFAASGSLVLGVNANTSQWALKIYGGNNTDRAPVISLFRSGNAEAVITQVKDGARSVLGFGTGGGIASFTDSALAAYCQFKVGTDYASFATSVLPTADTSYDLGNASFRWANIRGVNIYGTVLPTGMTAGSVLYVGGTGAIAQSNANFFWDYNNSRLGIGTASPGYKLDVSGDINLTGTLSLSGTKNWTEGSTVTNGMSVLAALLRTRGRKLYIDECFVSGANGVSVYDNNGTGQVVIQRVSSSGLDAPNNSGYVLQVTHSGTGTTPGYGGFYFGALTRANATLVCVFRAKIPSGYSLSFATNSIGTNGNNYWVTGNAGTGTWQDYVYVVKCGGSGTFSSTMFFYLTGSPAPSVGSPVTWYISSATVYDENDNVTYTVNGNIGGSSNYLAKWGSSGVLQTSVAYDDGSSVGIGTISPGQKLHVAGAIKTGNTGVAGKITFGRSSDGIELSQIYLSASALILDTGGGGGSMQFCAGTGGIGSNAERMRIDGTTGNVSIGTTGVSSRFTVANDTLANDTASILVKYQGGTDATLGPVVLQYKLYPSATAANRYAVLEVGDNTGYRTLALNPSGGNVGIGTTGPSTRFHVVATSSFAAAFTGSGGTDLVALGTTASGASINAYTASFGVPANLFIQPNGNNTIINPVAGYVAINHSSPTYPLHVAGRAFASSWAVSSSISDLVNNSPWYGIGISNLLIGTATGTQYAVQLAGYFGVLLRTSGVNFAFTQASLGLNTTTPTAGFMLDSRGSMRVEVADPRIDLVGTYRTFLTQVVDGANAAASYWRLYDNTAGTTSPRLKVDASGKFSVTKSDGSDVFTVEQSGNLTAGSSGSGMVLDFRSYGANRLDLRWSSTGTFYLNPDLGTDGGNIIAFENSTGVFRLASMNATSLATLKNSSELQFVGKYWTTSLQVAIASMQLKMDATTPTYRLAFSVGVTDAVNIRQDGYVGIGTTAPYTKTEINYGTLIAVSGTTPNTTTALTLSANDPGTTAAGNGTLLQIRPITNRGAVEPLAQLTPLRTRMPTVHLSSTVTAVMGRSRRPCASSIRVVSVSEQRRPLPSWM